jgi:hypothetical protein
VHCADQENVPQKTAAVHCPPDSAWKEITMAPTGSISSIYERPVEHLQRLIRFDTTYPPGNEGE